MDLIIRITLSPYFPQSNGLTECMVKTIKILLREAPDIYLTHLLHLSYRATPLPWCQLNPSELLMDRRLCTDVPQVCNLLMPDWPHLQGCEVGLGNISIYRQYRKTGVCNNGYFRYFHMSIISLMQYIAKYRDISQCCTTGLST